MDAGERITLIAILSQSVVLILIAAFTAWLGSIHVIDRETVATIFGAIIGYVGGRMHTYVPRRGGGE